MPASFSGVWGDYSRENEEKGEQETHQEVMGLESLGD